MKLFETLLICLSVATFVLVTETVVVIFLEGPHHVGDLRYGTSSLGLWLLYAGLFLLPGIGAWAIARASGRRRPDNRAAALLLVLTVLALPLIHVPLTERPVLARVGASIPGILAMGIGLLLVAGWLIRAARKKGRRTVDVTVFALVAAIGALAVTNTFLFHRFTHQIASPRGLQGLAIAVLGSWIFSVPLLLSLRQTLRAWAPRGHLAALGFYVAVLVAVVVGTPIRPPRLPSSEADHADHLPSILLIVIDTLRADVVSGSEDPSGLTPNIGELARDGVWFERAFSASPWTTPSFGSILTSAYPSRHHAGDPDRERRFHSAMTGSIPTLAGFLAGAGYWTGAILTNPFLARQYRLDRGFHTYQNLLAAWTYHPVLSTLRKRGVVPRGGHRYVAAERQTSRTVKLIDHASESGRPFFVLAHYMDPHVPYNAPHQLDNAPDATGSMLDCYRAEVAYCDHFLGELLDYLRESGLYDDMLIILTADHGEEFYEGRLGAPVGTRVHDHGHTVFDELIRVPLIIKCPGNAEGGTLSAAGVSLIDLAPTILELAGLTIPECFRGQNLVGSRNQAEERILFAEGLLYGREQKAAVRGYDKVILRSLPPQKENAEAYDCATDPSEQHPLPLEPEGGRFASLYQSLAEFFSEQEEKPEVDAVEIAPHLREQLRSLGYVQ